jgi:hypothetical protein
MTPEQIARRYYQLFNERQFDEAAALVDRQAVFHYLPTRQKLLGRAGYRALVAVWHTGDLVMGEALTIPATGRTADLPFTDLLEVSRRTDRLGGAGLRCGRDEEAPPRGMRRRARSS